MLYNSLLPLYGLGVKGSGVAEVVEGVTGYFKTFGGTFIRLVSLVY